MEDAGTSPNGVFTFELGNEFSNNAVGKDNFTVFGLIYGIVDWIEVEIDLGLLSLNPDESQNEFGFADMVLLSKFKMLGERGVISGNEDLPEVALEPSILIPTGNENKGLGTGNVEAGILLAIEDKIWLPVVRENIGYLATNNPVFNGNFENNFVYGFEVDIPLFIDRLILGSELTGNIGSGDDGSPLFSLTGLALEVTENIVLDGGIEFGLKDAESDVTVMIGATIGFNIFRGEKEFYGNF